MSPDARQDIKLYGAMTRHGPLPGGENPSWTLLVLVLARVAHRSVRQLVVAASDEVSG